MATAREIFQDFTRSLSLHWDRAFLEAIPTAAERWPELPWRGRLLESLPLSREIVRVRDARGELRELSLAWRLCDLAPEGAPTLVFLPGLGDSQETYRFLVETLAHDARLVLVDPPGFGRSEIWPSRHAFAGTVLRDALRDFLVLRGLNRPSTVLVGNSLGGALTMGIVAALGRRNRIGKAVLLAPAAFPQELTFWIELQRLPLHAHLTTLLPKRYLARTALWSSVGDPRDVTRESIADLERSLSRPWGLHAFQYLCRDLSRLCREGRTGRSNLLTALVPKFANTRARAHDGERRPVEVLLVHGDRDRVVPGWVPLRLAEHLPTVERILLPGMGHLPQLERPFAVSAEIRRFLGLRQGRVERPPSQRAS